MEDNELTKIVRKFGLGEKLDNEIKKHNKHVHTDGVEETRKSADYSNAGHQELDKHASD